MRKLIWAIGLAVVLAPAPAFGQWTTIVPGGDTMCSDGSTYRFFVHQGDPSKLLVEFEGGGGCWSGGTCEQDIYTKRVTTDLEGARIAGQLPGIYDRSNLQNPLRDFTHVYIPYCTGDLHWGNATTSYVTSTGRPLVVQHKGGANASAAVSWAEANVPAPAELVVAGCSAGGYGAALWSAELARTYPGARMTELADSAAGVVPAGFLSTVLASWGVSRAWPSFIPSLSLDRIDPATLSLPSLYSAVAAFFPRATFAQFNTRNDTVQTFFYVLAKGVITPTDGIDWSNGMNANVTNLSATTPNFRSYVASGNEHCVINKPSLYTTTSGGRRFVDWLRDLVGGADPGDVR